MGGGGGTLNNTRSEHLSVSKAFPRTSTKGEIPTSTKASLSHCAISQDPLIHSQIVCDKSGVLYNKEPLVRALLEKRAPSYIRSLKRDVTKVNFMCEKPSNQSICAVTFERVQHPRKFVLWWNCGCVTRNDVSDGNVCVFCGKEGEKVLLGLEKKQRDLIVQDIVRKREQKKQKRKRDDRNALAESDLNGKEGKRKKEQHGKDGDDV